MTYLALQLTLVLTLCCLAYLLGKGAFLGRLGLTALEEVGLLVPFGLGIVILSLFVLGLFERLRPLPVSVCLALLAAVALWRLVKYYRWRDLRAKAASIQPRKCLFAAALLALLFPVMLVALTPPYASDEIRYHLPYAWNFVAHGALVPDLDLRYPFYALNIDLLYSLCLLVGDDVTPHFMHLALGLLAAVNLYSVAARLTYKSVALCAALLFLGSPNFLRLASTAYIDLGLCCFAFGALASVFYAEKGCARPNIVCAAVLFGIALGSKYLALALIPLLLIWTFHYVRSVKETGVFLLLTLVVGLPWYAFNYWHTGNPLSPFAGRFFGYWPWSRGDLQRQVAQLGRHGIDATFISFVTLPYKLMTDHWIFSAAKQPWLLFAVFPAYFLPVFWKPRILPFSLLFAIAWTGWFFSAQVLRYLTVFFPVWCLLACLGVGEALGLILKPLFKPDHPPVVVTLLVLLVLAGYLNSRFMVYPAKAAQLVADREAFLTHRIPEYRAIGFVQGHFRNEVVMQMQVGAAFTYLRQNEVVGDWFGSYRYFDFIYAFREDPQKGARLIKDSGVTLIMARKSFIDGWPFFSTGLRKRFKVLYEDEAVVLFRIQHATNPATVTAWIRQMGSSANMATIDPSASRP